LFLRVLAARRIIVGQDDDVATAEESFAVGGKAVADATERYCERTLCSHAVGVLFAFRPVHRLVDAFGVEGVQVTNERNTAKAQGLPQLPTGHAVVRDAVP